MSVTFIGEVLAMTGGREASTRQTILTLLKSSGSLSVHDLAQRIGITEIAVRRHLQTLEDQELVGTEQVRQAMGRPLKRYKLTPGADDLFPKNYHKLTLDLLGELEQEEGEALVERLFDRRKSKLIQSYEPAMNGKSLTEKVAVLTDIQNQAGYMASWRGHPGGEGFELIEHNCPISQVASRYQHACACELDMFRTLLGVDVERSECLAKGGSKCVYFIKP
ncbi:helix-turn-helix transcriptional regulator [Paenibacillus sp. y28]|uniref:helix-turn-helix transcriptional regulator n=1 Tax=Paenibacillus sp. y28 TaxID=3129110 RepID=UPI003015A97F